MAAPRLFAGLMSGTSLDAVDAVLLELDGSRWRLLGHAQRAMPASLRFTFEALNHSGEDELHRAQRAAAELNTLYCEALRELLRGAAVLPRQVCAVGAHGQTVRHRPDLGYTLQVCAPAALAEACGITVVADFRSRDVAAGGQGAPLVPAFHRAAFGRAGVDLAVLNLGGIANLSLLFGDGRILGFDCGPGNALLDGWVRRHRGLAYDEGGAWAASATVLPDVLRHMLGDAYFAAAPPKSTGRDHFDSAWLEHMLQPFAGADPGDVQATLAQLSACSIAADLRRWMPGAREVVVCGGGVGNLDLLRRLEQQLGDCPVVSSVQRGIDPQHVEAAAFAWLAARAIDARPGNVPAVTGARGERVLGEIYPA